MERVRVVAYIGRRVRGWVEEGGHGFAVCFPETLPGARSDYRTR